jgi:hypothetical protein
MARSRALLTGSEAGSEARSKNETAAMIQFEQIVIAAPFMQSSKRRTSWHHPNSIIGIPTLRSGRRFAHRNVKYRWQFRVTPR